MTQNDLNLRGADSDPFEGYKWVWSGIAEKAISGSKLQHGIQPWLNPNQYQDPWQRAKWRASWLEYQRHGKFCHSWVCPRWPCHNTQAGLHRISHNRGAPLLPRSFHLLKRGCMTWQRLVGCLLECCSLAGCRGCLENRWWGWNWMDGQDLIWRGIRKERGERWRERLSAPNYSYSEKLPLIDLCWVWQAVFWLQYNTAANIMSSPVDKGSVTNVKYYKVIPRFGTKYSGDNNNKILFLFFSLAETSLLLYTPPTG